VGALVWWRVDRRIDETAKAVRTDVIASHNLVQRAVADGDAGCSAPSSPAATRSGRRASWPVFEGSLRRPRPAGPVAGRRVAPVVLPEPDEETGRRPRRRHYPLARFQRAVVTIDQPYRTAAGQTILQQTTVFRRGDQRWLLAPPLEEFWGEWETVEGEMLSLIYPRRDADVAKRLADDLDAAIAEMCATLEQINCSADLYLTARLDTDPQALADLAAPGGALRRARTTANILELPAPSLVGRPAGDEAQQEAAYAALRDGYARHILGAAIAQAVGWDCCRGSLLLSLLVEYQLAELGVGAAWPVGPADYRRALDEQLALSRVVFLGSELPPDAIEADDLWAARLAVDFLLHAGQEVSAADLQRRLERMTGFNQFARRVLDSGGDGRPVPSDATQAFWLYALQRAAEADAPPPLPDDETLYCLHCAGRIGSAGALAPVALWAGGGRVDGTL
jgi:hypothetical protein